VATTVIKDRSSREDRHPLRRAATTAATAGIHTSSADTASVQAVAAVVAARHSGLQRNAVAAAADSRMPSLTPAFFVFLTKCLLHMAQNTMFHGSFPNKLILPWND